MPLSPTLRRIGLVGPLADARADMRGPWQAAGCAANSVTIREGLAAALPDAGIVFAIGVAIAGADMSGVAAAREICRNTDLVLLCLGEAANMTGEAASRANPGLPGLQSALAEAIFDLVKPVVALISSGRPLMSAAIVEKARAVVATWFLGAEAANAIADVLTGRFNPAARLPVTWPRDAGQIPIFFAARPFGRPANPDDHNTSKYLDMPVEPLFFFGHGLSYSRFALTNLRASKAALNRGDELTIEVDVRNEGPAAGEEAVFLFARDVLASVARPLLEFKGVAKIALAPGEGGTVCFKLAAAALAFPGSDLKPLFEPGEFRLLAMQSADPRRLLMIKVRALAG
ncbi:MAG: glycoside hydrolase family 3 C-terminal domain-containing protein [Methylocella sp.]